MLFSDFAKACLDSFRQAFLFREALFPIQAPWENGVPWQKHPARLTQSGDGRMLGPVGGEHLPQSPKGISAHSEDALAKGIWVEV